MSDLRRAAIHRLMPWIEVDGAVAPEEWAMAQAYNAGKALDELLDLLTERADEWLLAIEGSMVSDLAVLADGLAVLRNPGSSDDADT